LENHHSARVFLETLRQSGTEGLFLPTVQAGKQPFERLKMHVLRCTQCDELVRNRHTVVFGAGNPHASLVFVGEAPGAEEDRQGLPFVGAAGQLLTKMIASIGLSREEVFITNVLKCRPPGNRPPRPLEIENCSPYLSEQISLIQPKIICALGTTAAQSLLRISAPISALRGRLHDFMGIPVLCTFHPAYLLRYPAEKRKSWEDLKKLRGLLDK